MQIKVMTPGDEEFATIMWPVLADQRFRKLAADESDAQLTEHPPQYQTWFVAVINGQVAGLCTHAEASAERLVTRPGLSIPELAGEIAVWENNFVLPEHRGQGVFTALFDARNRYTGSLPVITYVFRPLWALHQRMGFRQIASGTWESPDGTIREYAGFYRPRR